MQPSMRPQKPRMVCASPARRKPPAMPMLSQIRKKVFMVVYALRSGAGIANIGTVSPASTWVLSGKK